MARRTASAPRRSPKGKSGPFWESPEADSRLHLGNCLDIMAGLEEASVDCIWTDPPYQLSNGGVTCVGGKMVSVDKGDWDRSAGLKPDHEFNEAWIRQCFRLLKGTGTIWISGTLHIHPSLGMALRAAGFRILNDIVWEKRNPPPNMGCRTFTHSTELIFWASKAQKGGKEKYKFNSEAMKAENGGKQMKSVWNFGAPGPGERTFGKHPTQKPVALVARCLRASTDEGDLVFDPFAGSGTTGVAARQLGRKFAGIDISPEYLTIARKRISQAAPPHLLLAAILPHTIRHRPRGRPHPTALARIPPPPALGGDARWTRPKPYSTFRSSRVAI